MKPHDSWKAMSAIALGFQRRRAGQVFHERGEQGRSMESLLQHREDDNLLSY